MRGHRSQTARRQRSNAATSAEAHGAATQRRGEPGPPTRHRVGQADGEAARWRGQAARRPSNNRLTQA
eukprot:5049466-Alexandrium_andersonii.AAC.1